MLIDISISSVNGQHVMRTTLINTSDHDQDYLPFATLQRFDGERWQDLWTTPFGVGGEASEACPVGQPCNVAPMQPVLAAAAQLVLQDVRIPDLLPGTYRLTMEPALSATSVAVDVPA